MNDRSNNTPNSQIADFWEQMVSRARNNEWSTFNDPNYEETKEEKDRFKKAFIDAGWNEEFISSVNHLRQKEANEARVTTADVNPHAEALLERLETEIVTAVSEFEAFKFDTVKFVVEPKAGPHVSTVNVMMTDKDIITMGSFFTRYCGLISRAYIRTIQAIVFSNIGPEISARNVRVVFKRDENLLLYWLRIFSSFALTGTHMLTEFKPSKLYEVIQMEQMAQAMEIFALSHEYAHHRYEHTKCIGEPNSAKVHEFIADNYALKVSEVVERNYSYKMIKRHYLQNPYLLSGAGGVLLLGSIDIFRKFKGSVFPEQTYETHPYFSERVDKIVERNILFPDRYAQSREFCGSVLTILEVVDEFSKPYIDHVVKNLHSKLGFEDWEKMQPN